MSPGAGTHDARPGLAATYAASAFSLVAALLHFWVMPEHFEEWWGYGVFFLASAVAQAAYSILLLTRRPSPAPIWAGILGNAAIAVLWAVTRTVGVPLFGPMAGEVEEVGAIDVAATGAEIIVVALLATMLQALRR